MKKQRPAFLVCTLCALAQPIAVGVEVTYSYYRFLPTEVRDDTSANSVQLSEVEFYHNGNFVLDAAFPFVSNPGGSNPGGEGPGNAISRPRAKRPVPPSRFRGIPTTGSRSSNALPRRVFKR